MHQERRVEDAINSKTFFCRIKKKIKKNWIGFYVSVLLLYFKGMNFFSYYESRQFIYRGSFFKSI